MGPGGSRFDPGCPEFFLHAACCLAYAMNCPFSKYHALGNDYIVIDPAENAIPLTPENIRRICDRNTGVGSDGIMAGPYGDSVLPRVRILNPDGSEAEKSGNGVRIIARAFFDSGKIKSRSFVLKTAGGDVPVEICANGLVKAGMGRPVFDTPVIPLAGPAREALGETLSVEGREFRINAVSVGNPHCVILCDDASPEVARRYGPAIEAHPLFPRKINVQFMRVLDRSSLRIEIWERGAGYTLASGSSATASTAVAQKLGLCGDAVSIHMPGGTVSVEKAADGVLWLSGPVTHVMDGRFSDEFAASLAG